MFGNYVKTLKKLEKEISKEKDEIFCSIKKIDKEKMKNSIRQLTEFINNKNNSINPLISCRGTRISIDFKTKSGLGYRSGFTLNYKGEIFNDIFSYGSIENNKERDLLKRYIELKELILSESFQVSYAKFFEPFMDHFKKAQDCYNLLVLREATSFALSKASKISKGKSLLLNDEKKNKYDF